MQRLQLLFNRDARDYQILFLGGFLCYGIALLGWAEDLIRLPIIWLSCTLAQLSFDYATRGLVKPENLKSSTITSLGLTLLFRAGNPWIFAAAGILAIASKFIFRYQNRHFVNPANAGIVLSILLFGDGWVSPGQWGSQALFLFLFLLPGLLVVTRSSRLDTALAFLFALLIPDSIRFLLVLGWEPAVLLHKYQSGSLLLFTFFMITDPVSTPSNKTIRIIWAACIGLSCFYLQNFKFMQTAAIYLLFAFSLMTPLLNKLFPGESFQWAQTFHPTKPQPTLL